MRRRTGHICEKCPKGMSQNDWRKNCVIFRMEQNENGYRSRDKKKELNFYKNISSKTMRLKVTNEQALYLTILLKKIPLDKDKIKVIVKNLINQIDENFKQLPALELWDFERELQ